MRALRVVAIASIVCLACSDSTGLTLQGSPFMRARIDGRPFSLQESDVLSWGWGGTLGGFRSVLDQPARSISLRDRSEFGTDLLGPFFSKERPRICFLTRIERTLPNHSPSWSTLGQKEIPVRFAGRTDRRHRVAGRQGRPRGEAVH